MWDFQWQMADVMLKYGEFQCHNFDYTFVSSTHMRILTTKQTQTLYPSRVVIASKVMKHLQINLLDPDNSLAFTTLNMYLLFNACHKNNALKTAIITLEV